MTTMDPLPEQDRGDADEWAWVSDYPFEQFARAFRIALGQIVREHREARDYTQADLVNELGRPFSAPSLSAYEQATRPMAAEQVLDLCIALDLPMPGIVVDALSRARTMLDNVNAAGDGRKALGHRTSQRVGDMLRGRVAMTENRALRDELARLKVAAAEQRRLVEASERRAAAAEELAGRVRESLARAVAAHAAEVTRIRAEHQRRLRDAKRDIRAELVDRLGSSGSRPHEPVTGPTVADVGREARPDGWVTVVENMEIAEGADPFHVRVHNLLTPPQQFLLKAQALGKSSAAIAQAQRVPEPLVERDLALMRRRFRITGELIRAEHELRAIARELFSRRETKGI